MSPVSFFLLFRIDCFGRKLLATLPRWSGRVPRKSDAPRSLATTKMVLLAILSLATTTLVRLVLPFSRRGYGII